MKLINWIKNWWNRLGIKPEVYQNDNGEPISFTQFLLLTKNVFKD